MKRSFILILLLASASISRAQIPVLDIANLAETVASLAELRHQVRILLKEVSLSTEIKENTESHLHRYERALTKRGAIPMKSLGHYIDQITRAHQSSEGFLWNNPQNIRERFPMYVTPPDPVASHQISLEQKMSTLESVFSTLQIHDQSVIHGHSEIERMKGEINQAKEPQQMRDVQANIQVMHARELLLTRQAISTLANLQAMQAADEVSQKAQNQMRYMEFVGHSQWVGHSSQYDVRQFLK
ncbi:MAG: hypothetical protein OXE59_08815 [Bacteroidetes bacterium]|nr:hypothetical protein [Bacteroidota bacterium]MCY4233820.1 hypothetical protein [Bacteroidota bacterium]